MPEENSGNDVNRQPDDNSKSQPPVADPASQNPPSEPRKQNPRQQEADAIGKLEKDVKTGERWLIGIGILTLLVNIGIAKIYYGQLTEMQRATKATEQAAYAACAGSQIARASLVESMIVGQDTHTASVANIYQTMVATQTQEAHISIKIIQGGNFMIDPGQPIKIALEVKNTGNSSAIGLKVWARSFLVKSTDKLRFFYTLENAALIETSKLAAGDIPENIRNTGLDAPFKENAKTHVISRDEVADIRSGVRNLVVAAHATYKDSLGVRHWVNFCNTVPPMYNRPISDSGYYNCVKYNGEDSNSVVSTLPQKTTVIPGLPEITCTAPKN
jgi:hypothetical protein